MARDGVPARSTAEAGVPGPQDHPFVLPLSALSEEDLAVAGGKAASLGALIRAGFPVPPGFCVTTAAYDVVATRAALEALSGVPEVGDAVDVAALEAFAAAARERLLATPVPPEIEAGIREAYWALGDGRAIPVAVRSSATAEDLPGASFAGQQESYLNVVGADAVVAAVRRCWASLWTDRVVVYRAQNRVDQSGARLAVAVQRLVDAAVAGVLFTANPLTGRRRRAVIDASPGLGEAVVSGAVNPDHFVVDSVTSEVLERRLGDKRLAIVPAPEGGTARVEGDVAPNAPCLSDQQLRDLAALGRRVEERFGAPRDIEFAVGRDGALWLVQARPITTLFPLPEAAPTDDRDLRVYFNFNVLQGVFRPFTPMGVQAMRVMMASLAGLAGAAPPEPSAGPTFLVEAGGRVFGDVTGLVRSAVGRRVVSAVLGQMEARSEPLLRALFADPRLAPRPVAWRRVLPTLFRLLGSSGLALRVLVALLSPAAARAAQRHLRDEIEAAGAPAPRETAAERLARAERLLFEWPARLFPRLLAPAIVGLGSFALAGRLLGDLATPEERDAVRRALPYNPTTEMDLALWDLARRARSDPAASAALRERAPADLAAACRQETLPPMLQEGLRTFLDRYGHRAVAEIDLGMPRWAEEPAPLLGTLARYVAGEGAGPSPKEQFRAAARLADQTAGELARRADRRGRLRGLAVGLLLRRGRALAGLRETPKFLLVLLLARARALILSVGVDLTTAGRLEAPEDVFFLTLTEARALLRPDAADLRSLVRERRARYQDELRRRHLPRLLLSDGTEPRLEEPAASDSGEVLRGTPASAGRITGRARVVLDPAEASLEPGDVLVAPSTDPGWTPLFLTASGLVMEMGGAMSHGAVVAREYGLPAVVGVPGATERIRDGQVVVVDGTTGVVTIQSGSSTD